MHTCLPCYTTFCCWVYLAEMQMQRVNRGPGADHRSFQRPGSHLRSPEHHVQATRSAYTTPGSSSRHIRTQHLWVSHSRPKWSPIEIYPSILKHIYSSYSRDNLRRTGPEGKIGDFETNFNYNHYSCVFQSYLHWIIHH